MALCIAIAIFNVSGLTFAATYYVSTVGNDSADGTSPASAWKTCAKVSGTRFDPGDQILFQRGGEWRECLIASSDGSRDRPIIYEAYGDGEKARFIGSDRLDNARFSRVGDDRYSYPISAQAGSSLRDHVFISSEWADGQLRMTSDTDPRRDGRKYTACVRGNVIASAGKNHLIFRNLIVDETAGQLSDGAVQGYGVRIEGSTDVLVENCEAYRCGRHHFAAINSTGFIGRHLRAAYVQPNTPGGNTAFVSYADTNAAPSASTAVWDDIAASHLEDGHGGQSNTFVSHGAHLGLIQLINSTIDTKASFMSSPVIVSHVILRGDASIENFGNGITIDGVTLLDSSAIDQYGSNGIVQNCLANLSPKGGGATGYSAAIVLRDKAKDNAIRFNTLITNAFRGVCIVGANSSTQIIGSIFQSSTSAIVRPGGRLERLDLARSDDNFFVNDTGANGDAFGAWQARGFDGHSLHGDARFLAAEHGDFHLGPQSPCRRAVRLPPSDVPGVDIDGKARASEGVADVGAFVSDDR